MAGIDSMGKNIDLMLMLCYQIKGSVIGKNPELVEAENTGM